MRILYAEDQTEIQEIASIEMEGELNAEIVEVKSGNEAIEELKKSSYFDVIVCDHHMPEGSGEDVYQYMKDNDLQIPFILLSTVELDSVKVFKNFTRDNPLNSFLKKPCDIDEVIQAISKSTLTEKPRLLPEYCQVKIYRFLKFNSSNCDIYIKLTDDKFVKIINKDELFDYGIIEKYINKNIRYFCVQGRDFISFCSYVTTLLRASYEISEREQNQDRTLQTDLASISMIHEMIDNLGIEEHVVKTVQNTLNSTLPTLRKHKDLYTLMKNALQNKDYLSEHSLCAAFISGTIAIKMDWNTDSTLQKLVLASILHDLTLDDAVLAKVDHLDDEYLNENWRKFELVKNHPIEMAEMIRGIKSFPPDVDAIVIGHHELPDGSGYPRKLTANQIAPLTAVFIIAEKLANKLYTINDFSRESYKKAIKDIEKDYNKGNFRKPIEGLKKVLE